MRLLPLIQLCGLLFCSGICCGQTITVMGVNKSDNGKVGLSPYEIKGRTFPFSSTLDFSNCAQWNITTTNCTAELYRSREQLVNVDSYSGKLIYEVGSYQNATIEMRLKKCPSIQPTWNSLDTWSYGDNWGWDTTDKKKVSFYALFTDSKGKEWTIPFPLINYQYWFLSHTSFKASQFKNFTGFRFVISSATPGKKNVLYLSSPYLYQKTDSPISSKTFPSKLPFPLHTTTILPPAKSRTITSIAYNANWVEFVCKGGNYRLAYRMDKSDLLNGKIEVLLNNKLVQTITNRKVEFVDGISTGNVLLKKSEAIGDTLYATYQINTTKGNRTFSVKYTLKNQSLIACMEQTDGNGIVKAIDFGTLQSASSTLHQLVIPFMSYSYRAADNKRPWLFYNKDLFTLAVPDWYKTNASQFVGGKENNGIYQLGRAEYAPKTDGTRNRVKEQIFYNVSAQVENVFPTIDNPSSPYGEAYKNRVGVTAYGANLEYMLNRIATLVHSGVRKADVRFHEDTWRATGESFTLRTAPNPSLTVDGIRNFLSKIRTLGWNTALYTNYSDFATVSSLWNPDWVARKADGNWLTAWMRCYALKPQTAWEQEAVFAPKIKRLYNPNFSYCDVMTAVSPNERLDFDSRMPDAGMMRGTYERYAMLLMNERKAYGGPVISEGGTHWWYAGLVDGNYGNDRVLELPVFPDFNLLRIHPLEMDMGYMGTDYQYLAYTLAYGLKGFFNLTDKTPEIIRRYAMLQPLQKDYVMVPVSSIQYCANGKWYNTSDAIRRDLLSAPKLKVCYQSGLTMYINFGKDNWTVKVGRNTYVLPQYGFVACNTKTGMRSSSVVATSGNRLDEVHSPELYYLNTNGKDVQGKLGGNGCYMVFKQNDKEWEIVPVQTESRIAFDLSLLGWSKCRIQAFDGKNKLISSSSSEKIVKLVFRSGIVRYKVSKL